MPVQFIITKLIISQKVVYPSKLGTYILFRVHPTSNAVGRCETLQLHTSMTFLKVCKVCPQIYLVKDH